MGMVRHFAGLVLATAFLATGMLAWAEKIQCNVVPSNAAAAGFAVSVKPRENGMLRFTIVRDLAKAQWHGRDATLQVRDSGKLVVTCPVSVPRERGGKSITFWFDLSQDRADESHLTVTEIETAEGKEDGEKLLGGGTYYEFKLADFVCKKQ